MAKRKDYPGHLERRGSSFRVVLRLDGEKHMHTVRTEDRDAAEEYARTKYAELKKEAERKALGLPGAMPVSDLFDKYEDEALPLLADETQRSYKCCLKVYRAFFVRKMGDPMVDKVRPGNIRDFLNWRRTNKRSGTGVASNRTLQKDRAVLHAIFTFAQELELRDGNPVSRVKPPKVDGRDPVILTEDQFEALLEAGSHDPMIHLYLLALGETGARCESEVLFMRFEDVDLQEGFVWIWSGTDNHRTKSGKGRWVPMTPRLRKAMRAHFARFRMVTYGGKRSPWVFHHTRTRRHAKSGQRLGSLRRAFQNARKRAGLPSELHAHDLRHRRITTWLAEGKNAVHVKEAVGHADLRTTMSYTHLAKEHLRALVDQEPEREELRELGT